MLKLFSMENRIKNLLLGNFCNFVFLGEAGSGKSEIALNFAVAMKEISDKEVHFFDLDMTKPLFRSRDIAKEMDSLGITFHFEEQFMDAPTMVGGIRPLLKTRDVIVIIDVGGDDIGARAVGGFAPVFKEASTMIYYVLNAFRPWSDNIDHIDGTLGKILNVSHLPLDKISIVSNPNMGKDTTFAEVIAGHKKMETMVTPFKEIHFVAAREEIAKEVETELGICCMPLHLYLTYPWEQI